MDEIVTEPTPSFSASRRTFLARAGVAVFAAVPVLKGLVAPGSAHAASPNSPICTDTRKVFAGCYQCNCVYDYYDAHTGEYCYTQTEWCGSICC